MREQADERVVEAGDALVSQWELSKEFFVLVDGAADIEVDGERVDSIGAGDFFGELGALDWGAGFGYSRTATVRATERTRVLVMSGADLGEVMREIPLVESRIRAAVVQRLPRRRL